MLLLSADQSFAEGREHFVPWTDSVEFSQRHRGEVWVSGHIGLIPGDAMAKISFVTQAD